MKQLENKILIDIDKYELKEIKLIIKSFMMTYRGSKYFLNFIEQELIQNNDVKNFNFEA